MFGPEFAQPGPSGVRRGDGQLNFVRSGTMFATPTNAGDLDGDGRDEIEVAIFDAELGAGAERYLVPGATPPGTYDPADIGYRIDGGPALVVADRNGDGVAELLQDDAASSLPGDGFAPLSQARGTFTGFVDGGSSPTDLITVEILYDDPGTSSARLREFRVHLLDGGQDLTFTTLPYRAVLNYSPAVGRVALRSSDDGTFLTLANGERSANAFYIWRVDDPCGPLPDDAQPPTSTVAPTSTAPTSSSTTAGGSLPPTPTTAPTPSSTTALGSPPVPGAATPAAAVQGAANFTG